MCRCADMRMDGCVNWKMGNGRIGKIFNFKNRINKKISEWGTA